MSIRLSSLTRYMPNLYRHTRTLGKKRYMPHHVSGWGAREQSFPSGFFRKTHYRSSTQDNQKSRKIGNSQFSIGFKGVVAFVTMVAGAIFIQKAQAETKKSFQPKPLSGEELIKLAEELIALKAFSNLDLNSPELSALRRTLEHLEVKNLEYFDAAGLAALALLALKDPIQNKIYDFFLKEPKWVHGLALLYQLESVCFVALVQACTQKEWNKIPKNLDFISRITSVVIGVRRDTLSETLFLRMVREGKSEQVKKLIDLKIDYRYCDTVGSNGLHYSARYGHKEITSLLLDKFGINDTNAYGAAPIHEAVSFGFSEVVDVLLSNGAKLLPCQLKLDQDPTIRIPMLLLAVGSRDVKTIDLIIKKDPSALIQTQKSTEIIDGTVLHFAIRDGYITNKGKTDEVLKHLLTKYPEKTQQLLECKDSSGRAPLHLAAEIGAVSIVPFLVKKQGVSVNQKDSNERTPLHWAVLGGGRPEVIQELYHLGAQLICVDNKQETPLGILEKKSNHTKEEDRARALLTKLIGMSTQMVGKAPRVEKEPVENLVFAGGSTKGFAYVGVVQELERKNLLKDVERLAGTSAGAITAALLAVGYTSEELKKELAKNFEELLDPVNDAMKDILHSTQNGQKKDIAKSVLWGLVHDFWQRGGASQIELSKGFLGNIEKALNDTQITGLCKGDKLFEWVERLISEKTKIPHCTFKELHDLQKKDSKYKDLYVFAICLREKELPKVLEFSHEAGELLSQVPISHAVRASASIPGLFVPHVISIKIGDKLVKVPEEGRFIDGGLIYNFPISAFDAFKYQSEKDRWGSMTNRRTLGFKLETPEQTSFQLQKGVDLAKAIAMTYYRAQDILLNIRNEQDRIVSIPVEGLGMAEFALTEGQKQKLVEAGRNSMRVFGEQENEEK